MKMPFAKVPSKLTERSCIACGDAYASWEENDVPDHAFCYSLSCTTCGFTVFFRKSTVHEEKPVPTMDIREIERRIKADVSEATSEAEATAVERHAGHLVGRQVRFTYFEYGMHETEGAVESVSVGPELELVLKVTHMSRTSGHMITREVGLYTPLNWINKDTPP